MYGMNIVGHKYIFLTISGILVLTSFFALLSWGLKPGLDFTGGSLLEVEFAKSRPTVEELQQGLASAGLEKVLIQPTGDSGLIFRSQAMDEEKHQEVLKALASRGSFTEKRFDSIGPTIGKELRDRSIWALGLALLVIVLYIAWAFRQVSKPVSSWKYGVAALLALVHDVIIPTGIFSFLGHYRGVEIDTLFITALLTILGFSVHDTIVVFDRIRENLRKLKTTEPFEMTVNRSVNETMARSINTSFTVMLVLLAVLWLGGETVKYFSLALVLGVFFGTYSSIFVASLSLVAWHHYSQKHN